ncbi:MAG: HD domain-containing protein [Desulfobacteraceae bacterium]|nr:HD domain-containing protein [Desulfobacteraceae bacterium]
MPHGFSRFHMIKKEYRQLQQQAVRIAEKYPGPDFYSDFSAEADRARHFFAGDTVVCRLWRLVVENIDNDFGHGLEHVRNVALDAGTLILIECRGMNGSGKRLEHRMRLAQAAGLLHDIRRKEKKHAEAGARFARRALRDYPFSESDIEDICLAIANHEAFGRNMRGATETATLVSDCLYDADKFRWGPENFTRTLWAMVSYRDVPLEDFLSRYPGGMAYLKKIRSTFRTPTGKRYGPQIIDLGIAIGEELYEFIRQNYADRIRS